MLTAKATQSDKLSGLKHGADAYLTKPFDREELLVRIEKILENRQRLQAYYRELPAAEETTNESPAKAATLDELFLQKLRDYVEAHLENSELNVHDLCEVVHLGHTQTYRKIKALTGQTPTLFIRTARLQRAKALLQTTQLTVAQIAYTVGFSDPNYFSRVFQKEFSLKPSEVRA